MDGRAVLARVILRVIGFYRAAVSPVLPRSCRFQPSCSAYAEEAVRCHGAARGTMLAARRLLRCHPLGGSGCDPVPPPERYRGTGPDTHGRSDQLHERTN